MANSNDEIVTRFCNAWGEGDLETIVESFTADAAYHNIPMDPIVGRTAIATILAMFFENSRIEFKTINQVVDGDTVMNERIDIITSGDSEISLPVMGVFETVDGKIAAWRDYFDLASYKGE